MTAVKEKTLQKKIRLRATRFGIVLWRNNSGVMMNPKSQPVRFGLGNHSKKLNEAFKSSDLIGMTMDGRFVAIETKKPGWKYTGTVTEEAQQAFIEIVNYRKGIAGFVTSLEDFNKLLDKHDMNVIP